MQFMECPVACRTAIFLYFEYEPDVIFIQNNYCERDDFITNAKYIIRGTNNLLLLFILFSL